MICPLPLLTIRTVLLNYSREEQKHYDLRWRQAKNEAHNTFERLGRQKVRLALSLHAFRRYCLSTILDAWKALLPQWIGSASAFVLLFAVPPSAALRVAQYVSHAPL